MAVATFQGDVCIVSGDTTEVPPNSPLTINVGGRVFYGGLVGGDFTYRAAIPLPADFAGTIEVRLMHKFDPKLLATIAVGEPLPVDESPPVTLRLKRRNTS